MKTKILGMVGLLVSWQVQAQPLSQPSSQPSTLKTQTSQKTIAKLSEKPLRLNSFLQLGPAPIRLPAFHEEKKKEWKGTAVLGLEPLEIATLSAKTGNQVSWPFFQTLVWKTPPQKSAASKQYKRSFTYFSTWVYTPRFMKAYLNLHSDQMASLYFNQKKIGSLSVCSKPYPKKKPQLEKKNKKKSEVAKLPSTRVTLILTKGWHHLLIKSYFSNECLPRQQWKAEMTSVPQNPKVSLLRFSSEEPKEYSMRFMHFRKYVRSPQLSPDGKVVTYQVHQRQKGGKMQRWMETRRVKDGSLLRSSRPNAMPSHFQWSPDGKWISYAKYSSASKGWDLWLENQKTHQRKVLLAGIKDFSNYSWTPDSQNILYKTLTKGKKNKTETKGLKRLRGMEDRWGTFRDRYKLFFLHVASQVHFPLTDGLLSTYGAEIHPTQTKFLFTRVQRNYTHRPFSSSTLYEMDWKTGKVEILFKDLKFLRNYHYSPDGKKILLLGSANLFGKKGHSEDLQSSQIPNDYDTQAYVLNVSTKQVIAISKKLNPHILGAYWHPKTQHIYFRVLDKTRYRLVEYNPTTEQFIEVLQGNNSGYSFHFQPQVAQVVYLEEGVSRPSRLVILDLVTLQKKVLWEPNKDWLQGMELAKVRSWSFLTAQGEKREGRIYFPLHFDAKKKYPTIVYYYGGTYPTARWFDGSYSHHWWASQGYLVLILQPSGALGYGQSFSAKHSSEWGTIVPLEIEKGVRTYLQEHPFAHPQKVGCIGASYGGFTTMNLISKTKLFSAAVSHAGISNISSYWGAGFWGYLYNSISAPNRYPWSHPHFYVQNSALYNAHKIHTPLLLLHGTQDTNVPPSESYQLYTALKLLGRTVELVEIQGENHGVRDFKKKVLWQKTILAWFDLRLKGQKEWWEHLFPTPKATK